MHADTVATLRSDPENMTTKGLRVPYPDVVHSTVANLPPDPDNMNDLRAQQADDILVTFARQQGDGQTATIPAFPASEEDEEAVSIAAIPINPEVDLQTISVLMSQIGHLCDRNGFQRAEAERMAAILYSNQTGGLGLQFSA